MPKYTEGCKLNLASVFCIFIPTYVEYEQEALRKIYWIVVGFVQIGAVRARVVNHYINHLMHSYKMYGY